MTIRPIRLDERKNFINDISQDPLLRSVIDNDTINLPIFVITDEKEIIGYIAADKYEKERFLCLCYFYVKPEYRSQGYGTKLLTDVIDRFKNDYRYIYGFVDERNIKAFEYYKKRFKFLGKDRMSFVEAGKNYKNELAFCEGNYEVAFYPNICSNQKL